MGFVKVRFSGAQLDGSDIGGETMWAETTDDPYIVALESVPVFALLCYDVSSLVRIDRSVESMLVIEDMDAWHQRNGFHYPGGYAEVVEHVEDGPLESGLVWLLPSEAKRFLEMFGEDKGKVFGFQGLTNYKADDQPRLYSFIMPRQPNEAQQVIIEQVEAAALPFPSDSDDASKASN